MVNDTKNSNNKLAFAHRNLKSDGSFSDVRANLSNGLQVCIDWLAFTVTDLQTVHDVSEFMGFNLVQFSQAPRGAMGYKTMYRLDGYPVSILCDGADDMGIHVNISGSAVAHCVAAYRNKLSEPTPFDGAALLVEDFTETALSKFLEDILKIGHITRLDLAIDDKGKDQYFSCEDIQGYLMADQVVSKFRKWHTDIDYKFGGEIIGYTIYMGSRKSDVFLRVYDKRLEQAAKDPEHAPDEPWTRWELELKDDRACMAAKMLVQGQTMGSVIVGILSNYVRIVENDNENQSRRSVLPRWQQFIDGVKKVSLYIPPVPKTLEDKRMWIDNQALCTIIGLFLADGGSFSFLEDKIDAGIHRMKSDMRELVLRANPDAAEFFVPTK